MAVSAQLLVEELEIFGLECEEALVEKCESLNPSLDPSPGSRSRLVPKFTSPRWGFSVFVR